MRKVWLTAGLITLGILVLLALWLMLLPPRITGPRAPRNWLTATNPALELRYKYDPAVFKPAPYDDRAEFPLRLDGKDWSFYGKRIAGMGTLLEKEPAPVLYRFITDQYSSVYQEFYKLGRDGEVMDDNVELQGQLAVRQRQKLAVQKDSRGWPGFFPDSVTHGHPADLMGDDKEINDVLGIPGVTGGDTAGQLKAESSAWVYAWGLFQGPDLFLFEAVAPRELTADELGLAEQMINNMQFQALRGTAAQPPVAAQKQPAPPVTTPKSQPPPLPPSATPPK